MGRKEVPVSGNLTFTSSGTLRPSGTNEPLVVRARFASSDNDTRHFRQLVAADGWKPVGMSVKEDIHPPTGAQQDGQQKTSG